MVNDSMSTGAGADTGRTGLVFDPVYKQHVTGPYHPEAPGRCDAIIHALHEAALHQELTMIDPRTCTEDDILSCHTPAYLQIVKRQRQHLRRR